jgi:hypothetical protein
MLTQSAADLRDTSREYGAHDATSCNSGIRLEFWKGYKVNHGVEIWMPALHGTHIRVSDECDRFVTRKFSKYFTVLVVQVLFQGCPKGLDILAA